MRRAYYRLAASLHQPNLQRMSARRFREWLAYNSIEPFGELRQDYRTAQVVQMLFNLAVKSEDRKKVEEFLLKFQEEGKGSFRRTQTPEEQAEILMLLASSMVGQSVPVPVPMGGTT